MSKERHAHLKNLRKQETPDTKLCPTCEMILSLQAFYKSKNSRKGHGIDCKACKHARGDKRDKEKNRAAALKSRYNLTLTQYDQMLVNQGGCCKICGTDHPGRQEGRFDVDHNHLTKVVRGLLCHNCNLMVGMAKDNPATLRAAAKYLEEPT
jgi:hypothetical protein